VLNPFSVINPDEICCIEVETDHALELLLPEHESIFLRVTGQVSKSSKLVDAFFHPPVIMATYPPNGMLYINTRCIVRSRVYHSRQQVDYPDGLWFAEADDI
jgi:hypothetical protein